MANPRVMRLTFRTLFLCMGGDASPTSLRTVVREVCAFDPGPLAPSARLCDLGLVGLGLLDCITAIEERYDIEFPADLLSAMETVDDLLYYTNTKLSQR